MRFVPTVMRKPSSRNASVVSAQPVGIALTSLRSCRSSGTTTSAVPHVTQAKQTGAACYIGPTTYTSDGIAWASQRAHEGVGAAVAVGEGLNVVKVDFSVESRTPE